jgi:hypothetical protein
MKPIPALRRIARDTGIPYGDLSDTFHDIKRGGLLGPADNTLIDRDGNVYDAETGEELGNVIDESGGPPV